MATPAYMTIRGVKQGAIASGAMTPQSVGRMSKSDHPDEIQVQAFSHKLLVPVDIQNGQPTGLRQHPGFTITKIFDRTSPLICQALATSESIEEITIKWFRTGEDGKLVNYFTHTFHDALVVGYHAYMLNCLDKNVADIQHMEEIAFSYKSVQWEHVLASTMGGDSWDNPGQAS